ncbi:MAG: MYG1 family protein [Waddliaceae bacterium]
MIEIEPKSFGTHDSGFHADEVTACALLLRYGLIEKSKIHRTRDPDLLKNCEIVCDVGGIYDPEHLRFDHHQADYNGDLSSAGMILLYLKEKGLLLNEEYHHLNNSLIKGVDAHDNGKDPQIPGLCTYSHIIANLVPVPYDVDEATMNQAFFEAVALAKQHMERVLKRFHYIQSCRHVVEEAMESNARVLIFKKKVPWVDLFFQLGGESHPAEFIIMPSEEHWVLRGVPPNASDKMSVRVPLPKQWAGLLGEELQKATGIPGAIFCHKGRFISVWETKQDAIHALEQILKDVNEEIE